MRTGTYQGLQNQTKRKNKISQEKIHDFSTSNLINTGFFLNIKKIGILENSKKLAA